MDLDYLQRRLLSEREQADAAGSTAARAAHLALAAAYAARIAKLTDQAGATAAA